jgi:putative sterol carrier protein
MAIFKNREIVEKMFGEIWSKMVHETEFGPDLKKNDISIFFTVKDPEVVMYVDENGPLFGDDAKAKTPVVTMAMSGDNVHKFWLRKLNITKAMALLQIRTKGPITKVLQILPLLKPGQEMYPEYCEKYELPTA